MSNEFYEVDVYVLRPDGSFLGKNSYESPYTDPIVSSAGWVIVKTNEGIERYRESTVSRVSVRKKEKAKGDFPFRLENGPTISLPHMQYDRFEALVEGIRTGSISVASGSNANGREFLRFTDGTIVKAVYSPGGSL